MSNSEFLTNSLQENLLVLLIFNDKVIPTILSVLEPGHFSSDIYKQIAIKAIDYYNQYRVPPKLHISDLFEAELEENTGKSRVLQEVLQKLYKISLDVESFNVQYILSQLHKFVKLANLKVAVRNSVDLINDEDVEGAERILSKALQLRLTEFDSGFALSDINKSFGFLREQVEALPTGIQPLDDLGLGLVPQQLLVLLGSANRGKSSFLVHLGKYAAATRKKVLHISLEMSEQKMCQRYFQSFFGLTKRQMEVPLTNFEFDELRRLNGFSTTTLVNRKSLRDDDIATFLKNKIKGGRVFDNLWIKRFPTSSLTISGLENFLDALERSNNFVPDVLLVDYADIMKLDQRNLRISIGDTYKELRRIAVERNVAVGTVSQANRLAEGAKVLGLEHLGEDYSKAATADDVWAYVQTKSEERLGLARLIVLKARDEERNLTILMSQAYRMSQFCVNAVKFEDSYWNHIGFQTDEEYSSSRNYGNNREQLPDVPSSTRRRTNTRNSSSTPREAVAEVKPSNALLERVRLNKASQ